MKERPFFIWSGGKRSERLLDGSVREPKTRSAFGIVLPALADVATSYTASARGRLQTLQDRGVRRQTAVVLGALVEVDTAFEVLLTLEEWSDANPVLSSRRLRNFYPDLLSTFREDPRYDKLIRTLNRAWGLNPDGSFSESTGVPGSPTVR